MSAVSDLQLDLNLAFPNAGVVFNIKVEPPSSGSNGQAPSFSLRVTDSSGQRAIQFNSNASPELADWVRGYTRWLFRANVSATHDENGITGTFTSGLSPEQTLLGLREACGMIRQRFELYEQSVLA